MTSGLRKKRVAAYHAQGGKCFACGGYMWERSLEPCDQFAARFGLVCPLPAIVQCTAEHVRARADGGKNKSANIVATCAGCNWLRGTWHAQSFRRFAVKMRKFALRGRHWRILPQPVFAEVIDVDATELQVRVHIDAWQMSPALSSPVIWDQTENPARLSPPQAPANPH